jgi:hypothetical protein
MEVLYCTLDILKVVMDARPFYECTMAMAHQLIKLRRQSVCKDLGQ